MGVGENKTAHPAGSEDTPAKDVARLYAWANVEGIPYRDFSRQRKIEPKPATPAGEEQAIELAAISSDAVYSEVTAAAVTDAPPIPAQPGPAIHTPIQQAASTIGGLPVVSDAPVNGAPEVVNAAPASRPAELESLLPPLRMRSRLRFVDQPESQGGNHEQPILAVHSRAGGVGKSTLCANLARVLCSLGEQIYYWSTPPAAGYCLSISAPTKCASGCGNFGTRHDLFSSASDRCGSGDGRVVGRRRAGGDARV